MTVPHTHETTIEAPADVPAIVITREFDATPERVCAAHTDPEVFARWCGPRGTEIRVEEWDARTGGHYRYTATTDGEDYAFYGSFHEVRPGERIVQTFTWTGYPDSVSLETMTLTPLDGGRCRIEGTSLMGSFEGRDGMLASGMDVGVREGFEQLDEILAAGA